MLKMTKKAELCALQQKIMTDLTEAQLIGVVLEDNELGRVIATNGLTSTEQPAGLRKMQFVRVLALSEIARRAGLRSMNKGSPIQCSADVSEVYRPKLSNLKQEVFMALSLDAKNRVIAEHEIFRGTLTQVEVHPREVFRALIRDGAAHAIVIHNHPSGDPKPSSQDRAISKRLTEVGELLGITLLDFIIVGAEGSLSFRDTGLMGGSK